MDKDFTKIEHPLAFAKQVLSGFTSGRIKAEHKTWGCSAVMVAGDREVDCNFASTAAGWFYCRKVFVGKELGLAAS